MYFLNLPMYYDKSISADKVYVSSSLTKCKLFLEKFLGKPVKNQRSTREASWMSKETKGI